MNGGALDRGSIGDLVAATPPLIESYISLEHQLQPNGFDLTLREVALLTFPRQHGLKVPRTGRSRTLKPLISHLTGGWNSLPNPT